MKANEFLQIFELGKTFDVKPKRRKRKYVYDDIGDIDISALLHRKLQEADVLKKLLDDREKANKKEEKKEEKLTMHQIAMFLVFTFPITAPLYVQYVKSLLH